MPGDNSAPPREYHPRLLLSLRRANTKTFWKKHESLEIVLPPPPSRSGKQNVESASSASRWQRANHALSPTEPSRNDDHIFPERQKLRTLFGKHLRTLCYLNPLLYRTRRVHRRSLAIT